MKKSSHSAPSLADEPARIAFVSLMTVFGSAQTLLKDRMRAAGAEGLGPLHLRILCLCAEQPGVTQQQLADLVGRDKGQVAHLLHALEADGLVARTPDDEDRRILRLSVTAAGAAAAHRFMAIEAELAQHLFAELPAGQVEQLKFFAQRLLLRVAPGDRTPV